MKSLSKTKIIVGVALGLFILSWSVITNLLYPKVILSLAFDLSASAMPDQDLRTKICRKALNEKVKTGDYLTLSYYADVVELQWSGKIESSFALNSVCKNLPTKAVGKQNGTTLSKALERVLIDLQKLRQQGHKEPILVIVTLNAAEPVAGEMENWSYVKEMVKKITGDKGMVIFAGTKGALQGDLALLIEDEKLAKVCPTNNVDSCIGEAFGEVRQLK